MAEKQDRTVEFISRLVQMTQDGEIKWVIGQDLLDSMGSVFYATVNKRNLRLFQVVREELVADAWAPFSKGQPEKRRVKRTQLELLDDNERPSFVFEKVAGLSDLYDGAAFSASGVADLMNSVLKK